MVMKINNEKEKKVTAKVKGIIKKMNKTYGGSILKAEDHTSATRDKFQVFLNNMGVNKD